MSFGAPQFLALLAAVPLAGLALAALWRWRAHAETAYAGRGALVAVSPGRSPARRALKTVLLLGALALVALAAARPQIGDREVPVERRGVDLMIVLDVSESMEATDIAPSRRGRAQEEINALLDRLPGDRVGLVLVSGSAFLRSPLTSDLATISQMLDSAPQERLLLQAGTALAGGIDAAAEALSESETAARIILVVSDGEDLEGQALEAARSAAQDGMLVYSAGAGTAAGSTIPVVGPATGETQAKVDPASGAPVITRLDESLLRALASAGGGRYVALEGEGTPLAALAGDFARLQSTLFASSTQRQPEERLQWFLGGAALLLVLEMAIADTGRRPRWAGRKAALLGPLALVVGLLAAACGTSVHSLNDDGNRFFAQGQYDRALESYQRAQAERPDLLQLDYNIGNALHRLGDYPRAIEETQRAAAAVDSDLAFRAYYSLGNHYFRLGQLQDAFDAYKQALTLNPDDLDAKYNLEVVSRALAEQQPPPEQSPEGGPSQGAPPGEATPAPGQSGGQQGEPQPGQATPAPGQGAQQPSPERSLEEALAGIDENFTIEDAMRVLDALREQQRLQPEPSQQPGSGQGQDY